MYLLIGADFVPTESNRALFKNGDTSTLFGEKLGSVLKKAEYRIFNLEVPLTDSFSPIDKQGPHLMAPTSTINGYKAAGVDLLTLANNHILDQGVQGLHTTTALLDKYGIAHVGVGEKLEDAQQPYIFDFAGKRVGVYACAEHEFSIATDETAGANPFDPLFSLDHVAQLKQQCDFVIVLYHGGKEHYRYPSPNLQKTCRRLVDKGADLVICQHSHCIGCEEKYASGTIVYGQGNFLFDHSTSEFWQTGLLIRLDDAFSISYLSLVKNGNTVRMADETQKDAIMGDFEKRSKEIQSKEFVSLKYNEFSQDFFKSYLKTFSGSTSFLLRAFNRLSGDRIMKQYLKIKYRKKEMLAIINCMDCEAHRELCLNMLNRSINPSE